MRMRARQSLTIGRRRIGAGDEFETDASTALDLMLAGTAEPVRRADINDHRTRRSPVRTRALP